MKAYKRDIEKELYDIEEDEIELDYNSLLIKSKSHVFTIELQDSHFTINKLRKIGEDKDEHENSINIIPYASNHILIK